MSNVERFSDVPDIEIVPSTITEGGIAKVRITNLGTRHVTLDPEGGVIDFEGLPGSREAVPDADGVVVVDWDTTGLRPSSYRFIASVVDGEQRLADLVVTPRPLSRDDIMPVSMGRAAVDPTPDQILWTIIRNRTAAIGFDRYDRFLTDVMEGRARSFRASTDVVSKTPYTDAAAYNILKVATERFLMHEAGVIDPDEATRELTEPGDRVEAERARVILQEESRRRGRALAAGDIERLRNDYYEDVSGYTGANGANIALPYLNLIRNKLQEIPIKNGDEVASGLSYGISYSRVTGPLAIEYIWSYWMEESGMVQTINAVAARFQNRRLPGHQQLARLDLDPLRPLSNLLWGYVQDEPHRLTLIRRAYEYAHHYGLTLEGRAVPQLDVADNRTRFLSAFHGLLNRCAQFFPQDDDTTVIADGFPVLNALREVHMVLAEGAHNQFGDLPSTARVEMLMQQWLLGRPEMREYLGGRVMVPYAEQWMDRVDTVRSMLGFGPASVSHFRDLAVYGEQILLPVRYGSWSTVNDAANAANWARYWRPEIQRYIHAYQAVTGVDLSAGVDARRPSRILRERALATG